MKRTNTQKTINELCELLFGSEYKLDVELQMYNKKGEYIRSAYNLFRLNRNGKGWMKAKDMVSELLELCDMTQPNGYKREV